MKANRILLLCSALALPQLAMAGLSETNPQGLGDVHAFLTYCAVVDPGAAAAFQAEWNNIVGGESDQVAGLEATSAYKEGAEVITAALNKLRKSEVAAICAAAAVQWRGQSALGKIRDELPQESKHGNTGVHSPELK